jgi:hypothetical protein
MGKADLAHDGSKQREYRIAWPVERCEPQSLLLCRYIMSTQPKEDIREQPTPRNLSATATRVLLCTYMPCCSFSEIFFSYSHLTSPQLTSQYNNIILHLLLVLCTAVNVRNKN